MNNFKENVKELRKLAGLSQEELAEEVGVSLRSIQRFEQGLNCDLHALNELAEYFNVSTDYLLGKMNAYDYFNERRAKLLHNDETKKLYVDYLKCINKYEIMEESEYFWISIENGTIGGQTQWVGWADEKKSNEIRRLRPVKPQNAIYFCTTVCGKPMVLNSEKDAILFLRYGGQAIVRKDICEKYLPQFMGDYIVPRAMW